MLCVFGLLDAHPELVANIKIVHGVEQTAPEISRDTAEGLIFAKHVIEPRLSAVRGDVQALFRVVELIARKVGIPQEDIEAACATAPGPEDDFKFWCNFRVINFMFSATSCACMPICALVQGFLGAACLPEASD